MTLLRLYVIKKFSQPSEEIIEPYSTINQIINRRARGSNNIPQLPVSINIPFISLYCYPLILSIGFSMNEERQFSKRYVEFFAKPVGIMLAMFCNDARRRNLLTMLCRYNDSATGRNYL
ncbi:fructose 1,6-bisphosphatase [Coxiella-like endosymbiont]|uniref:fructose 1,6-bisphosphatase n=1 Tax=Coxiella-like endosymbiont TaxID=1592897 RepID=UPI0034E2C2B9